MWCFYIEVQLIQDSALFRVGLHMFHCKMKFSRNVFVFINCAILVFQTVFHILLILKYIIYSTTDAEDKEDPRILGLAMIPGHQIVTVHIDENNDIDHRILWYCYQSCLHYFWVYSGTFKLIW